MEPAEALGVAAQVAVTLAGFAGVVVVFRPDSVHQWSALDRLRLRLLLSGSIFPLGYALFAMLLLTMTPPPPQIWRWCSALAAICAVAGGITTFIAMRKISRAELAGTTRTLFYPVSVIGTAAILLQFYNISVLNRFWPFFFAIVVHIIAAMLQFMRIVLLPPHTSVPK